MTRRRRLRFNPEIVSARIFVVAAAVGGAMAGCRPTGWIVTDRVVTALFAGLVALATSRARRWTWLVLAGGAELAVLSADDNLAKAMAAWSLLLALGSVVTDKRDRAIGALTGGLAIEALLRLRGFEGSGVSAAFTAAVTAPVLWSAYRRVPDGTHRNVKRGLLIGSGVAAVLMLPVVIGVLMARPQIEKGIDDVRAGFDAADQGDQAKAMARFRSAESHFRNAKRLVASWWTAPARVLPLAGVQAEALSVATQEGDRLAVDAARLADAQQAALSVENGTVSIDAVRGLAIPLSDAAAALEHASRALARIRSPFLLPQIADRLDRFSAEVESSLPATRNAQAAVQVAPALLGSDAPRRYMVLFTTPAEARGTGGFVGSWALLTVDRGHIELSRNGRISELNQLQGPPRRIDGPAGYLAAYNDDFRPGRFFQNVTASPDFRDVGSVAAQLVPQTTLGVPIDGVFVIDPIALARMLQLTGPVSVPGLAEPLTAKNAERVLLVDQYALFPNRRRDDPDDQPGTREGFLADALKATFDAFLDRHLPGPATLVNALGPMVEQRRLLAFSTHPEEEALFSQLTMDGAFPSTGQGDFLSLVTTNRGGNKLDVYLHRKVTYDVAFSPSSGAVTATATVVLRNDAPPDGLPFEVGFNDDGLPVGTNQTMLTLYTPFALADLTLDGESIGLNSREEFGIRAYTAYVDLPPMSSRTVVFKLSGSIAPADTYGLRLLPQPLANPDNVQIRLTGAGGWHAVRRPGITLSDDTATATVDLQVLSDLAFPLAANP